ncbi:MAG: hypothetical protein QW429_04960 [Thermoprotei archaeon]
MTIESLLAVSHDLRDIAVELVRAANSNPLIGILVSVITVDILARTRIIDPATAAGLYTAIGVIEGASVGSAIINDFTDVFHLFSNTPTTPLTPSANVIVYGDSQGKDIQALLQRLEAGHA